LHLRHSPPSCGLVIIIPALSLLSKPLHISLSAMSRLFFSLLFLYLHASWLHAYGGITGSLAHQSYRCI
jgi:hypothetical protein